MRAFPIVALLALGACDSGVDLQRMTRQSKAVPYSASDFFADGASMQPPCSMSFAQEQLVSDPARDEGATSEGFARVVPIPVTRELLERGRDRFMIHCAPCHGVLGDAHTEVARRMELRPPRSLHDAEVVALPPGRLYDIVRRGYGLMPSYEGQLPVEDRWAIVAYVRVLETSQHVPLDELPAAVRSEALVELGR